MSNVTIELNKNGIRELLQSDEIMKEVESVARTRGEISESFVGFDRCHVIVKE